MEIQNALRELHVCQGAIIRLHATRKALEVDCEIARSSRQSTTCTFFAERSRRRSTAVIDGAANHQTQSCNECEASQLGCKIDDLQARFEDSKSKARLASEPATPEAKVCKPSVCVACHRSASPVKSRRSTFGQPHARGQPDEGGLNGSVGLSASQQSGNMPYGGKLPADVISSVWASCESNEVQSGGKSLAPNTSSIHDTNWGVSGLQESPSDDAIAWPVALLEECRLACEIHEEQAIFLEDFGSYLSAQLNRLENI